MYRVTVKTNGVEYPLHEPRDDSGALQLIDPILKEEVGKNQTFTFMISSLHPNKDKIIPMSSEIFIYKDNVKITCCRMVSSESDLYNTEKVTCEGELAYLIDSLQRPYEYTGSLYNYFVQLLNAHNSEVEERKRFTVGNVTIAGTEITRSNAEYSNTMTELISQLTDINGGYLHVRYSGNTKYLDYVSDYGGINTQVIRFGENILDLTKSVDPTKLITALVPTGATITSEETDTEDTVVDIKSVNGGIDYIYDVDAVAAYGWIWGSQKFDDVADPEVLLAKARAYLNDAVSIPETIELSAVDLSDIGVDVDSLHLGYWTDIVSKPHGLNTRFLLSKMTIGLANRAKNSIVLGKVIPKFAAQAAKEKAQITARVNAVASNASKEINRKVENATQLITGGKGGYVVLDVEDPNTGKRTLPWRILIMDTPDKDTATSVIQFNKNGFGFSTTGINGPYRNAWTIDGNLVADFITTGTMLADRIRGGMLEVGGSGLGKDGIITVKNASDAVIGTWDKTGLHVLLGVIEGSEIRGSAIIGGAINIGSGTFYVSEDGEVVINAGTINIGNVYINSNYTWLGDYGVSAQGSGAFYSRNGEIELTTSKFDGTGPALEFKNNGVATMRLSANGLVAKYILLNDRPDFWGGWTLTEEIILLHNRVFGTDY
jgi:phage minor structural protein